MTLRDLYAEAFGKATDDYYTSINAAAKNVFIEKEKVLLDGLQYARRVVDITEDKPAQGEYWKTATIAEAFLIQKKYKEAGDMYEKAVAMARVQQGTHELTFIQAKKNDGKTKSD
jgi:hypothetical protein